MDDRLMELARRANQAHQQGFLAAVDAGKALLAAKQIVKHGNWAEWVKANCKFSKRTAQVYMQIARNPRAGSAGSINNLVNPYRSRGQVSRHKRGTLALRVCETLLSNGRRVTQQVNKLLSQMETT